MREVTYGQLSCLIIDPPEPVDRLLVLCHGYGAAGDDLVPIGQDLARRGTLGTTRMVFPEAPERVTGMWGARCWWHLDAGRYFELIARGALQEVLDDVPSGLAPARRKLAACVDTALRDAGLGYGDLFLGGFSQGAMLTTDLALRLEEAPAALCILSGALIARPQWSRRAPGRAGLRVLQTHGTSDMVLPFTVGNQLRELLEGAGLQVDFHRFAGGHGVPPQALDALEALIAAP